MTKEGDLMTLSGSSLFSKATDVDVENDKKVVEFGENNNKVMLAFIASYAPARLSPVERADMSIGLSEEFGFEEALEEIKDKCKGKAEAILVVNSPGGLVDSSYKIAKTLRATFSKITVCVPHVAASGGTLIALTGDEIILGPMSQLSPIDVQIGYGKSVISTNYPLAALGRLNDFFKDKRVEEAPYPMKAMADKLDPLMLELASGLTFTMQEYAKNILKQNMKDNTKIQSIVDKLTRGYPCHDYLIDYEEAKSIGLPAINSTERKELWNLSRLWLSKYVLSIKDKHIIRFYVPKKSAVEGRSK